MDRGDRWLVGWGLGYVAVGAASLLVPLYALGLYAAAAGAGGGLRSVLGGWLASVAGYLATFGVAGTLVVASVVLVGVAAGVERATPSQPPAEDRRG